VKRDYQEAVREFKPIDAQDSPRLTGEGGLQQDAAELLERSLQTGEPAPAGG
jgi:hypothetical protein